MADDNKTERKGSQIENAREVAEQAPPAPKRSAIVANPEQVAPNAAPGANPLAALLDVLQGLEAIARAEASQPKPSARAWKDLHDKLVVHLEEAGVQVTQPPRRADAAKLPQQRVPIASPHNRPTVGVRPGGQPLLVQPPGFAKAGK